MELLLFFLFVAFVSGLWSSRRDRPPRAWPLVLFSLVVALGYLFQRFI